MSYHVDRLYAAISVLVAHGPIKQRLIRAYEQHLEEIEEDELPLAVQEFFVTLRRMMHCVSPANGEGPICAAEISQRLEAPIRLVRDILYDLVNANVLAEIKTNGPGQERYQPAMAVDRLTIRRVIERLDKCGKDSPLIVKAEELDVLSRRLEAMESILAESSQNVPLKDL